MTDTTLMTADTTTDEAASQTAGDVANTDAFRHGEVLVGLWRALGCVFGLVAFGLLRLFAFDRIGRGGFGYRQGRRRTPGRARSLRGLLRAGRRRTRR